jgi:hypothetical protein
LTLQNSKVVHAGCDQPAGIPPFTGIAAPSLTKKGNQWHFCVKAHIGVGSTCEADDQVSHH